MTSLLEAVAKARAEAHAIGDFCPMCSAGDHATNGVHRGQHACGFLIRIRELEGRVEDVVLQRRLLECAGEVSKDNRTFKLIPYDLYRDLCNALAPKP